MGPPKLPSRIVEEWDKVLREIFSDQEIISKLAKVGMDTHYLNGHEFREYVREEVGEVRELWGKK